MQELVRLLEPGRPALVTITGRGGVGKTALAGAVLHALDEPARTTWVPLAGVTEPALVESEIGAALGIQAQPGERVLDAAAAILNRSDGLLVLDNAEHLLAAAPMVGELMDRCPGLRVLITSQAPLRLRSEQVFTLDPLPVPAAGDTVPLDELAEQPAVAVYIHRAAAVDRRFVLTEENAAVVAELCRRLGGLPLAIELAAARAATLPPGAILAHLERAGLDALRRDWVDAPARHHDLRAAIDWTYGLLSADEQRALRHLTTTVGTFDIEAVLELAPAHRREPGSDAESLDQLSSLVDFHLVDPLRSVDTPRFAIPDSIRAHARAELDRLGESAALDRRRIVLRARQARSVADGVELAHGERRSVGLESDRDDLLDALGAALSSRLADEALDIARGLGALCDAHGYGPPQEHLLEGAIELGERSGCDPARLANVMLWFSYLGLRFASRHPQGVLVDRIRSAEELARGAGDDAALFHTQCVWVLVSPITGDFDRATAAIEEGFCLADSCNNQQWRSILQVWAGMMAHHLGDDQRAIEMGMAALSTGRRMGDKETVVKATLLLATMVHRHPHDIRDLPSNEEALSLARETDLTLFEVLLGVWLVYELLLSGDTSAATRLMVTTLELARTGLPAPGAGFVLIGAASTAHVSGDDDRAAFFHGAAQAAMPVLEAYLTEFMATQLRTMLEDAESALGKERFDAEVELGAAMDYAEAVVVASNYMDSLLEVVPEAPTELDQPAAAPNIGPAGRLTPRQIEVLLLLASGLSNKEIAARLGVRAKTVMHHTTAVYRELGVRGRSEATAVAFRSGLMD